MLVQGTAHLGKANELVEQGGVMKGGKSGSLEECLALDPENFATAPALCPPQGVVST